MPEMVTFKKIRQLRIEKELSQQELAQACSLSTAHVSLIERGKRNPSFKTLACIAEALDVPLQTLLDDGLRMDLQTVKSRHNTEESLKFLERLIHDLRKQMEGRNTK